MIRARFPVCLLSLALALPLSAAAQDSAPATSSTGDAPIPLDAFVRTLDRIIQDIDAAATPADASRIAAGIPARWHVDTGSGTIDVSSGWLIASLAEAAKQPANWPAMRAEIRRRADAVRQEAGEPSASDAPGARARARVAIGGILSRQEFQQSATARWRDQLRERVMQWIDDLWSRFGTGPGTGAAVVLAWTAAIAALIGLGFWLARSIADLPSGSTLNLGGGAVARPRARELALRALAQARAGNPREAVRCAYNAALVQLEEEGAWKVDDARTPREYLPMLEAGDARRSPVVDLTQRFERIWYGNRPVSADDTPRVAADLETLGCLRPGDRAT